VTYFSIQWDTYCVCINYVTIKKSLFRSVPHILPPFSTRWWLLCRAFWGYLNPSLSNTSSIVHRLTSPPAELFSHPALRTLWPLWLLATLLVRVCIFKIQTNVTNTCSVCWVSQSAAALFILSLFSQRNLFFYGCIFVKRSKIFFDEMHFSILCFMFWVSSRNCLLIELRLKHFSLFNPTLVAFVEKTNLNFNPWSETCQLIRLTVAIWTWNLNDVNFIPFSWLSSSHHCKMEKNTYTKHTCTFLNNYIEFNK
jgi:hypothetical protein